MSNYPWIIRRMGIKEAPLPFLGDNQTAFNGSCSMDLTTNPAAVNAITCYTSQYNLRFAPYKKVNNKHIYLTGLSVMMQPLSDGLIKISVRWDQYHITHHVRWTGPIILKEQLQLDRGVTLLLDQNESPVQLERDTASGFFSPATSLVCERGSHFITAKKSTIILDDKSKLVVQAGAHFELGQGSKLILRGGSEFIVEPGALYENRGGKVVVKKSRGKNSR